MLAMVMIGLLELRKQGGKVKHFTLIKVGSSSSSGGSSNSSGFRNNAFVFTRLSPRSTARGGVEQRCTREETDAAACPFFTRDDPNGFIDEWNQNIRGKNREHLQLEAIPITSHRPPTTAFIDRSRSIMHHYSGFSLIIQNSESAASGAAKQLAQFITVFPKKMPFTSWRPC